MTRSFFLVLSVVLLHVVCDCYGELLKIRIVDHEDQDPKISATVVNKNSDQLSNRRQYNIPSLRRNYRQPVATSSFGYYNEVPDPYLRHAKYRGSTVYSENELKESLGSLVNSILMSRMKYPVNKIYIFSRNSADMPRPGSEPVYQVYDNRGNAQPYTPSTMQIEDTDEYIRPIITPEYHPTSAPFQVTSPLMDSAYHLPKVTESVEDYSPDTTKNYAQELKNMQKFIKKQPYKAPFQAISRKKPTSILNERAKVYADFMKSREYFLPKVEPDHHTEQPVSIYFTNKNFQRKQPLHYEGRGQGQGFGQSLRQGLGQGLGQSLGQGFGQGFGQGQQRIVQAKMQMQGPQAQFLRKQPSNHHHVFTTQNIEFTANDAIREYPQNDNSSEEDEKLPSYKSEVNSFTPKSVDSASDSELTTEDAIRLLESRRYTVPRDCSSRCLEQNSKNYDPVCGSDGRTYLNDKMLICLTSCRSVETEVDYQGPCN